MDYRSLPLNFLCPRLEGILRLPSPICFPSSLAIKRSLVYIQCLLFSWIYLQVTGITIVRKCDKLSLIFGKFLLQNFFLLYKISTHWYAKFALTIKTLTYARYHKQFKHIQLKRQQQEGSLTGIRDNEGKLN